MTNDNVPREAVEWAASRDEGMHPEDMRLIMRDLAMNSTYFMGKIVLGFKDMTPHLHKDMCKWIDNDSKRKLGLAPRDHLKTSVWTIANTTKRVTKNPNIRILLGNETATNASHFLRRIQAVFDRNVLYRWLFPELCQTPAERSIWNQTEMLIPRSEDYPEATIEVIGVGGAVVSRHYDLIKLDDLVGKEASESEEVMKKTIDWYAYCESLLIHPTESEIQNYGTRWAKHDVHSWALENEIDADAFYRSAEVRQGDEIVALWPERFNLETLRKIKKKMGPYKYSCQYLNDPVDPEAQSFHESWLRFYDLVDGTVCIPRVGGRGRGGVASSDVNSLPHDEGATSSPPKTADTRAMRRTLRIDPAISEDDKACNSAIIVDGVDYYNRKWLLENWYGHVHPIALIENALRLAVEWQVEEIGIEGVAWQKALKPFMEKEMNDRGISIPIRILKTDNRKSKKARIRGVQPYFYRGEIYVREDQEQFLKEYRDFPTGELMDNLDAFAYGPEMWETPLEDVVEEQDVEVRRQQWHEGRSAITGY